MDEKIIEARKEEIKEQIKTLKEELKSLSTPSLTSLITEIPYDSYLRCRPNYVGESDAWADLLHLGRRIWIKRGQNMPYIKTMTKEQLELSAEMLNEMIPVYNKYWEKARAEEWRKSR